MRGVEVIEAPAKSLLNRVKGMPFEWSINCYRGCFHQCVFCYARRTHSYLNTDGVADWGSKIYVKTNATSLLRFELAKSKSAGIAVNLFNRDSPDDPVLRASDSDSEAPVRGPRLRY